MYCWRVSQYSGLESRGVSAGFSFVNHQRRSENKFKIIFILSFLVYIYIHRSNMFDLIKRKNPLLQIERRQGFFCRFSGVVKKLEEIILIL